MLDPKLTTQPMKTGRGSTYPINLNQNQVRVRVRVRVKVKVRSSW